MINKYSALMLVIVFPILLNAFLFHLYLDSKGIGGALLTLALAIFLIYKSLNTYKVLWLKP